MPKGPERQPYAPQKTLERRFLNPLDGEQADFDSIYKQGKIEVGSPELAHQFLYL